MNANGRLYARHLKSIFLISLVFCVLTVFGVENALKYFSRTTLDLNPRAPLQPYWFLERDSQTVAIYLLSAIGSNSTDHVMYERGIRLQGWIHNEDSKKRIKCCFLLTNGTILTFYDPAVINKKRSETLASQITCPLNALHSDVSGVTVLSAESICPPANDTLYLKPHWPTKEKDEESFAMCLKVVYGNIDNNLFIDWLEFNRLIKVDKIFMYTYNISERTEAIIKHYVQMGFVETRPFKHPPIRELQFGEKHDAYYDLERVVIFDCLQRASGFKYMALVDVDEFVVPREHGNVKDLMKYLTKEHPRAAGFHLIPYLFLKNVKPDKNAPTNGSDIVKYFKRTDAITQGKARRKNIMLTARVNANGTFSHNFEPIKNHFRVNISSSIASLNHYRTCYPNLVKRYCSGKLITDKEILTFVKKFPERKWNLDARNTTDL